MVFHEDIVKLDFTFNLIFDLLDRLSDRLLRWKIGIVQESLYRYKIHLNQESPSDSCVEMPGYFDCHLETNSLNGQFRLGLWKWTEEANACEKSSNPISLHINPECTVSVDTIGSNV